MYVIRTDGNHRLNGDDHAGHQSRSAAGVPIVGNLRLLVELLAHTVTNKLPHHTKAVGFHAGLNRMGDIRNPEPSLAEFQSLVKALPGHFHQLAGHLIGLAADKGGSAIPMKSSHVSSHVHAHDVAFLQHPFAGNAVDHHVINGNAGAGRKTAVAKERRSRSLGYDVVMNCLVNGMGRHTGTNHVTGHSSGLSGDFTGFAHDLNFVGRFDGDHTSAPRAARISLVAPSMG